MADELAIMYCKVSGYRKYSLKWGEEFPHGKWSIKSRSKMAPINVWLLWCFCIAALMLNVTAVIV